MSPDEDHQEGVIELGPPASPVSVLWLVDFLSLKLIYFAVCWVHALIVTAHS